MNKRQIIVESQSSFCSLSHKPTHEHGQALVETALVLIILLMFLGGVIDLGRAYFTYLALHNAAAEGAYYGSAFPLAVGTVGGNDSDTIIYRAQNESPSYLVNWDASTVDVFYQCPDGSIRDPDNGNPPPPTGALIVVQVIYPFEMIGPLPNLMGWTGPLNLKAEARQIILGDMEDDDPITPGVQACS